LDTKSEAKTEAAMPSKPDKIPDNVSITTLSDNNDNTSQQFDLTVDFISEALPSLLPEDSICEATPSLISVESSTLAPQSLFSQSETSEMPMPEAPSEVPPMLIPAKNPKLYQLVQMSGESSFWWDSTDSSNADGALGSPDFGQNFATNFDSYDNNPVHDGNAKGKFHGA
jgi:hypothetical protein